MEVCQDLVAMIIRKELRELQIGTLELANHDEPVCPCRFFGVVGVQGVA